MAGGVACSRRSVVRVADLRPKGRGRPQRILLGVWPDEHIRGVIRAVVFRDTHAPHAAHHIKEEVLPAYPQITVSIPDSRPPRLSSLVSCAFLLTLVTLLFCSCEHALRTWIVVIGSAAPNARFNFGFSEFRSSAFTHEIAIRYCLYFMLRFISGGGRASWFLRWCAVCKGACPCCRMA